MTDAAPGAARPLPAFSEAAGGASWLRALGRTSLAVLGRPALWVVALAGFLVRGGLVLLLLPIVVLPSPIQLAASFGLDAVSISGEPTTRFVVEVAVALVVLLAWVLVSSAAGGIVEIVVGRGVAPRDNPGDDPGDLDADAETSDRELPRASTSLVWELLLVRLVTLVPVVVTLIWGLGRVIDVGYREVTVPSDTATPLVVRIVVGAGNALIVILAAWLLMELILAVATRHLLFDRLARRSGVRASRALVRRPLPVVIAFVFGTVVSIAALAAGVLATQATWNDVLFELRAGTIVESLVDIVLLVLVWSIVLAAAAFLSAWRSGLMTAAYLWTMEAQDGGGP